MEELLDILKYIIPALVVFATSYYVMKLFLENESRKRMINIKLENARLITPIRLQAFERAILLLERITPSNLIMRLYKKNISSFEFQSMLIQNIRDEFEHNLSQQIYISEGSWDLIKNAKEEVVKLINTAATQVSDTASSTELSQIIIEKSLSLKDSPTAKPISALKKEIAHIF